MKKTFYKLVKLVCVSAILLACVSCADGPKDTELEQNPAEDSGTKKEHVIPAPDPMLTSENPVVGSWFFNCGYNPDVFANDYMVFKDDGTVYLSHEEPGYCEYDTGTYSIIEDAEHGSVLVLNITWYKYIEGNYVEYSTDIAENFDLHLYYSISSVDEDKFIFYRFKRDFSAMNGPVYEFNPPVLQDFSRIKKGTKDHLIGTWKFNKRGTQDADWEETWVFNDDGTMESFWSEGADSTKYKGNYEVITGQTGSVLHQTLTQESADGITYTNLTQPMEFWYDYLIDNDYVINVNCTKDKIDGEEHVQNPPIVNFYYRDIELYEVTYHWANATFKEFYPKGTEYTVLDMSKSNYMYNVHRMLKEQKLFGWYDNEQLSGNPVTTITANKDTNTELWAKWGIYYSKNVYDATKGKDGYNYNATLPISVLAPDMALPSKGDTLTITFSANVSKDFNGGGRIALIDYKNDWIELGGDWHNLTSNNGYFNDTFVITVEKDPTTDNYDELCFDFNYENSTVDEEVIFSDFEFKIVKSTN